MSSSLTIGQLAAETELPTDTIRYYESVGLLPPARRSAAGYRLYSRSEVRRLQLIKRGKLLGLSLAEVKDLVDQAFTDSCRHLQQTLLDRIPIQLAAIDQRIADLRLLKAELAAMQDHLHELGSDLLTSTVAECENCPCIADGEGR